MSKYGKKKRKHYWMAFSSSETRIDRVVFTLKYRFRPKNKVTKDCLDYLKTNIKNYEDMFLKDLNRCIFNE